MKAVCLGSRSVMNSMAAIPFSSSSPSTAAAVATARLPYSRGLTSWRCARARTLAPAPPRRDVARMVASSSSSDIPSSPPPRTESIFEQAQQLFSRLQSPVNRDDVIRTQYSTSAGLRFAFFLMQNIIQNRVNSGRNVNYLAVAQAMAEAVTGRQSSNVLVRTKATGEALDDEQAKKQSKFLRDHMGAMVQAFQQDMENVVAGKYKFPYDMSPSYTQQWNPLNIVRQSVRFHRDQMNVFSRRQFGDGFEVRKDFIVEPDRYPDYYLQNFHYQTDGWLSTDSSRLYDFQVETLFMGGADAMRRHGLEFLSDYVAQRGTSELSLLDVASGNGRFLSFVKDSFPSLETTALELSPFYLAEAKKLLKDFPGKTTFVEANAEKMPLQSESMDAITNVYLYHELPEEARINVTREMFRVLKPGGKVFFVDSLQQEDSPELALALNFFRQTNHEPYHENYSTSDLKEHFRSAGFTVETVSTVWVTKVMVLGKPAQDAQPSESV